MTDWHRRVTASGDQIVQRFSASEDALIRELHSLGMGPSEIAKFVNAAHRTKRSPATIGMRLKSKALASNPQDPTHG